MLGFSTLMRNETSPARGFLVKTLLQYWLSVSSLLSSIINPFDTYRRFQGCSLVAVTVMMLFEGPARVLICFKTVSWKSAWSFWLFHLFLRALQWLFFSFYGIFLHSLKCLISKSWWWSHGEGNWFWFSIAFSCHSWEPPDIIPTACPCCSHSSHQDKVGGSPQVSAWWWERQAVLPKEAWVVHPWALLQLVAVVSCSGVPFTHLWVHCAQNSILLWGAMGSAREKNDFALAFLQPGGNSRALSEPRVYRTDPSLPQVFLQEHSVQPGGNCCREEQHWGSA